MPVIKVKKKAVVGKAPVQKRKPTTKKPKAKPKPKVQSTDEYLKQLIEIGERRAAIKKEDEELLEDSYRLSREANEAGVSMVAIAKALQINRQWLYNMKNYKGRKGK